MSKFELRSFGLLLRLKIKSVHWGDVFLYEINDSLGEFG